MGTGLLKNQIAHTPRLEPLPGVREFHPRKLLAALQDIQKRFGDLDPRPPREWDLRQLHRRAITAWQGGRIRQLSRFDLRSLPWILFYTNNREEWLGASPELVDFYEGWLAKTGRARSICTLLRVFLEHCDESIPTYEQIRSLLRRLVLNNSSPLLRKWRDRCISLGLLEPQNHRHLRNHWRKSGLDIEQFVEKNGLPASLDQSALLRRAIDDGLPEITGAFAAADPDASRLSRWLRLLVNGNRLRFDELRLPVADAVLRPFVSRKPGPIPGELIREFFISKYGDPRVQRAGWAGIPQELRDVVFRLLVESTIEDFFSLLDRTALDEHWMYRKTFWNAYLKRGAITDAWVALGPRAADLAYTVFDEGARAAGELYGYGIQGNHSVLLMRIEGITVVEWSHNGACRFWLPSNHEAPRLYSRKYERIELTEDFDFKIVHRHSERGNWQQRVAQWLYEETRVQMYFRDYMPRQ